MYETIVEMLVLRKAGFSIFPYKCASVDMCYIETRFTQYHHSQYFSDGSVTLFVLDSPGTDDIILRLISFVKT